MRRSDKHPISINNGAAETEFLVSQDNEQLAEKLNQNFAEMRQETVVEQSFDSPRDGNALASENTNRQSFGEDGGVAAS